jgi:radical SAM superfamily enzyme YgiQ (UPF0313 family)
MKITLVNPYELGRQPFGLAEAAAWLEREGCTVVCCDLSLQRLDDCLAADTALVAIYLAMHTATRIAIEALPKIQRLAPAASLCVYGLYAPMNADLFRSRGVAAVLGGEYEPGLVSLVRRLRAGKAGEQTEPEISLARIDFIVPQRDRLPDLSRYAGLMLPDGGCRTVGFTETTRGCKYFCRHCPVVPVYEGKFRVIPVGVVLDDIRTQIGKGARHISFGDPDFFNGPGHALRVVRALHEEFPAVTYDATIKIEHIVKYPQELRALKDTGCLFVTSAVESVDDGILRELDKGHTRADFIAALAFMRAIGIDLSPTFVAFTPWTTLANYLELLREIVKLRLVESVAPVQLSIRLLIPAGSYLLHLESLTDIIEAFDPRLLGHPWRNPDPRVDQLQQDIQTWIAQAERDDLPRREIFHGVWERAHRLAGIPAPPLDAACAGKPIPRLSENWYCCAEPTSEQLVSF